MMIQSIELSREGKLDNFMKDQQSFFELQLIFYDETEMKQTSLLIRIVLVFSTFRTKAETFYASL